MSTAISFSTSKSPLISPSQPNNNVPPNKNKVAIFCGGTGMRSVICELIRQETSQEQDSPSSSSPSTSSSSSCSISLIVAVADDGGSSKSVQDGIFRHGSGPAVGDLRSIILRAAAATVNFDDEEEEEAARRRKKRKEKEAEQQDETGKGGGAHDDDDAAKQRFFWVSPFAQWRTFSYSMVTSQEDNEDDDDDGEAAESLTSPASMSSRYTYSSDPAMGATTSPTSPHPENTLDWRFSRDEKIAKKEMMLLKRFLLKDDSTERIKRQHDALLLLHDNDDGVGNAKTVARSNVAMSKTSAVFLFKTAVKYALGLIEVRKNKDAGEVAVAEESSDDGGEDGDDEDDDEEIDVGGEPNPLQRTSVGNLALAGLLLMCELKLKRMIKRNDPRANSFFPFQEATRRFAEAVFATLPCKNTNVNQNSNISPSSFTLSPPLRPQQHTNAASLRSFPTTPSSNNNHLLQKWRRSSKNELIQFLPTIANAFSTTKYGLRIKTQDGLEIKGQCQISYGQEKVIDVVAAKVDHVKSPAQRGLQSPPTEFNLDVTSHSTSPDMMKMIMMKTIGGPKISSALDEADVICFGTGSFITSLASSILSSPDVVEKLRSYAVEDSETEQNAAIQQRRKKIVLIANGGFDPECHCWAGNSVEKLCAVLENLTLGTSSGKSLLITDVCVLQGSMFDQPEPESLSKTSRKRIIHRVKPSEFNPNHYCAHELVKLLRD